MTFATSLKERASWTIIWMGTAFGFLFYLLTKIDPKRQVISRAKCKILVSCLTS